MKSIYEQVGGTYTRQGDYEFADLKVPPEKVIEIGVWGQRYRRYLKQHHRIRYYNLLTAAKINEVLPQLHAAERYEGLTGNALYVSSKIAFGFNYIDATLDITHDNDQQGDHGTHVAGIATANRYVENADGT